MNALQLETTKKSRCLATYWQPVPELIDCSSSNQNMYQQDRDAILCMAELRRGKTLSVHLGYVRVSGGVLLNQVVSEYIEHQHRTKSSWMGCSSQLFVRSWRFGWWLQEEYTKFLGGWWTSRRRRTWCHHILSAQPILTHLACFMQLRPLLLLETQPKDRLLLLITQHQQHILMVGRMTL